MESVLAHLDAVPLAELMLVVTLGFLLGRLRLYGVSMGPAGGTLGVAIVFGLCGMSFAGLYGTPDPRITLGGFGFALFIYSVGFDAGPRVFDSFRAGQLVVLLV